MFSPLIIWQKALPAFDSPFIGIFYKLKNIILILEEYL